MVLSLTDILTAQQVDRPYKPDYGYKNSSPSADEKPVSFSEALNKPEAKETLEYPKQFTSRVSDSIKSLISPNADNDYSVPADIKKVVDSTVNDSNTNLAENTSDITTNQVSKITLSDLTNALDLAKTKDGTLTDQQISLANQILVGLANAGIPQGVSAEQVIQQVVAQVQSNQFDANSSIDDILQKMNFANLAKIPQQVGQNLESKNLGNAEKIKVASQIIEVAKEEAAKPLISASDLKSFQTASLSNLGKKKDEDKNGQQNQLLGSGIDFIPLSAQDVSSVINKDTGTNSTESLKDALAGSNGLISEQKNINNSLQLDIAQENSSNSQTATQAATQQGNIVQTVNPAAANAISQLTVQTEASKNEIIAGSVKDTVNTGGVMSTENFIKFQNMLDESQATTKSTTNTKLGSPAEVLAQIKFGIGSKGKYESNISIQLHPKELGKVDISMQMAADGKTHITIIAENTDTLNLLQKESGALRGMLTDALQTDSSNLNFTFQQGGSDDWRQQFANGSYLGNRNTDDTENLIGNNYLSSQSYRYNMIATDGLDIRV